MYLRKVHTPRLYVDLHICSREIDIHHTKFCMGCSAQLCSTQKVQTVQMAAGMVKSIVVHPHREILLSYKEEWHIDIQVTWVKCRNIVLRKKSQMYKIVLYDSIYITFRRSKSLGTEDKLMAAWD